MPDIKPLVPDEWERLKKIRLAALQESPDAFLSTYDKENAFSDKEWQAEFDRGIWHVCTRSGRLIGLVGVTRERETPSDERFLEYIWVAPGSRREHVALEMVGAVLDDLRVAGVRTVYLWVLDGNEVAVLLYQRLGFVSTGRRQPIEARPGRTEEQMKLVFGGG